MDVEFLRPTDAPAGRNRLLERLRAGLRGPDFTTFRMVVAFAKVGPLLRLEQDLVAWRAGGKSAEAVFGFDHLGTSRQALELASNLFDRAYLTHNDAPGCTFRPKMYLLGGAKKAADGMDLT